MLVFALICFVGVSVASDPRSAEAGPYKDPTFGGIFTTARAYIDPEENNLPKNEDDDFDWALSKEVFKESKDTNIIISPLSVKILLTLLAEAAGQDVKSKTRQELEAALPYNKDLYGAKDYFKKVLNSLHTVTDEFKVNMATKIFVDDQVKVNQRFGAIAQTNYWCDIEEANFNNARETTKNINDWVKEKTNGKIKDLVTEDAVSNSIVLMLNALYFEGAWRFPFNTTLTRKFTSPKSQANKAFMEHTGNYYFFHSKNLQAKIVRLPYKGHRFAMYIILPDQVNGLNTLVENLEIKALRNELWHMDELEVTVVIPKFRFDMKTNMNEVVKKLGIRDIFDNNATLPLLARGGHSEGKLKVSNIIQKSGIIVDEIGTTAWSATEIELVNKFGGEPSKFIADHPFLFYVQDDTTGAKLFSGTVNDPNF